MNYCALSTHKIKTCKLLIRLNALKQITHLIQLTDARRNINESTLSFLVANTVIRIFTLD